MTNDKKNGFERLGWVTSKCAKEKQVIASKKVKLKIQIFGRKKAKWNKRRDE